MVQTSWQMDPKNWRIPEEYQETCGYFLASLLMLAVTNAVLDVAWIRHRWRHTVLLSKVIGMISIIFCLLWPSRLVIFGCCISFANGFADPRLHFGSIRRNPAHPLLKWWFCITLLLHHAGGAFITNEVVKPLTIDNRKMFDVPIPILVSCLCELFAWFTDLKVLMRTAPRWFNWSHQVAVVIQITAFLITFFCLPHFLNTYCLFGTVIGSASWLIAGFIGFKNSTHEIVDEVDLKGSVARVFHKECPMTEDHSILPFCKKDALGK